MRIKQILSDLRNSEVSEIAGTKVIRFEDYNECVIKENGAVSELKGCTKADVLK